MIRFMNKCFISSVGNQNQNQKNKLTRDEVLGVPDEGSDTLGMAFTYCEDGD